MYFMDVNELSIKVNQMEKEIRELIAAITGFKIDMQLMVRMKDRIKPGTGCKIYYDANGLVMNSEDLSASDIPNLPMEKIDGLLEKINKSVDTKIQKPVEEKKIKPGRGIKISYDEFGRVTSSDDKLLITDIPELDMNKIRGLEDTIKNLREELNGIKSEKKERYRVAPGTYTKITYGDDGRVMGGTTLTMDDIPMTLINKINLLENRMASFAGQEAMSTAMNRLNKKLDANVKILGGTYTKVQVDDNGLVTQGDRVTVDDIGTITINNIAELPTMLKNKANQTDMVQVLNTLNRLATSDRTRDVVQLKTVVEGKADNYTVKSLESQINTLSTSVDNLLTRIPDRSVMQTINRLVQENDDLKQQIKSLEKEMNRRIEELKNK